MTGYIITIPDWHPTVLNRLLGAHPFARTRMKKKDAEMIWAYSVHVPKAEGRRGVQIQITQGRGSFADPDAHHKSTLDALVNLGLLVDDSIKWLQLEPTTFKRGKKETAISIWEVS